MKKKLLIIGAGIGQVHIVKLAQQMGCYVIVVSPKGNYPAIEIANELFECDIYDSDRIVEFARSKKIDAVTSDQNDLMMPTVAYVSEALGLPGNSFQQVMSYCDKSKFRQICEKNDVPVPTHIEITDSSFPTSFTISLPWIIKPCDSQSCIGISKISRIEEYKEAATLALSKSKLHKAILEQYFVGREYVCEGFVFHGKYYNLAFGDRIYFKNTLIPSQTIFPSDLSQNIKNEIIRCEERISKYINANFGIIHSEYLVNEETGDFCIVESAIRGGGVYISSHLIPLSTGIDVDTLLLKCALGEEGVKVDSYLANPKTEISAYMCFTLPEGTITHVSGIEEISKISSVKMCYTDDIKVGLHTKEMSVKGSRKGPILIQTKTRKELNIIGQIIKDKLTIRIGNHPQNAIIW